MEFRDKKMLLGFSVIAFLCFGYEVWRQARINRIFNDPQITTGWIINYDDGRGSAEGQNRTITYAYIVDSVKYTRIIQTVETLSPCSNELDSLCSSLRFVVIWENNNPSNSLINLYRINPDTNSYSINIKEFK